ncbi:MAG: hypothetical protein K6C97_12320 [Treponema sp.]|nr:hypothetical protein [Treponema sp.]
MKVKFNKCSKIDKSKIVDAVHKKEDIEFEGYTVTRDFQMMANQILAAFLSACNKERFLSSLSYSSSELLGNADKANIKRCFCKECNLDINNPLDYEAAMIDFKMEISSNLDHYRELQKKNRLYVKYRLSYNDGIITLSIINKATLTEAEKNRISKKLERAKQYHSIEEAYLTIDQSEGSGLGIIIIVLMLKQIGLGPECFNIESKNGETISSVLIPA